jgi:TolB-like protein
MNNFFGELKRRNVYKVAVAYAVVGWLIAQIATQIFPFLEIPNWIVRLIIVLIASGFPIALVIAWAFEATPEGIKRTEVADAMPAVLGHRKHAWIYIVVICAAISFALFLLGRYTAPTHARSEALVSIKSVAVLPFVNMSSDQENAYFADGLTEEILSRLAQIKELTVPGRTSSFVFKNQNRDLREIGASLGVTHVLEGSVRKSQDRLRITAQLERTSDGYHVWSQTYDRKLDDVFAIQEEIARAIADALSVQLKIGGSEKSERPTQDMTAYDNYLEARALITQRNPDNLRRAITLLEGAVQRDPRFSKAWGALAQARALGLYFHLISMKEALDSAEDAARKALAIDDSLAAAHSALADVLRDRYDWSAAEAEYRRALELSPGETETHNQYAQMLLRVGHLDAALEHANRARELDPLAWVPPSIAAMVHLSRRDFAQCRELIDRSEKIRGKIDGLQIRVELFYALSNSNIDLAQRAVVLARSSSSPEWSRPPDRQLIEVMDQTLANVGGSPPDLARALKEVESLGEPYNGVLLAAVAAFVKQTQPALDALWFDFHSSAGIDAAFIWTPVFQSLRNEPRFLELLKTMKLPEYWQIAGWGDFCQPKDGNDFDCTVR